MRRRGHSTSDGQTLPDNPGWYALGSLIDEQPTRFQDEEINGCNEILLLWKEEVLLSSVV